MADSPEASEDDFSMPKCEEDDISNIKVPKVKSTSKRLSLTVGDHFISRMDQLNDKIGTLSICLDGFSLENAMPQLVADNHADDPFFANNSAAGQDGDFDEVSGFGYMKEHGGMELLKKKSKQALNNKELDQFAGMYSIKMVLSQSRHNTSPHSSLKSFRKKMQSKIGMSESSHGLNKKPMLVELHSFPGYDSDEITPLPSQLSALHVLKIVTSAQLDLERKPTFKREFTRFFYSRLSQAILCDTFWWYFCEKHQQTPESQEKLFNRIAHNYTKLLIRWIGSKYQETLFGRYPDLLAQSVYATFCQAFPTSYRQFDDKFKDDLIFLVHQWITGARPAPRAFEKWNFEGLEPSTIRKGEKHQVDPSKKSKRSDFELELNEDTLNLLKLSDSKQKAATSSQISGQTRGRRISRATAPQPPSKRGNPLLPSIQEPGDKDDVTTSHSAMKVVQQSVAEKGLGKGASHLVPTARLMPTMRTTRESCKAGRGPSFSKNVFDVYGRSPLIEQFLMSNNLSSDAGVGVLVRRTEIETLPSALTYDDIIKESQKFSSRLEKKYHSMVEENAAERAKSLKKQQELQRRLSRRTAELMASPNEVKRISNLLRLHLLRDQNDDYDSLSADIKAELSKALGYDVVE